MRVLVCTARGSRGQWPLRSLATRRGRRAGRERGPRTPARSTTHPSQRANRVQRSDCGGPPAETVWRGTITWVAAANSPVRVAGRGWQRRLSQRPSPRCRTHRRAEGGRTGSRRRARGAAVEWRSAGTAQVWRTCTLTVVVVRPLSRHCRRRCCCDEGGDDGYSSAPAHDAQAQQALQWVVGCRPWGVWGAAGAGAAVPCRPSYRRQAPPAG